MPLTMRNKGYVILLDALVALMLILIVVFTVMNYDFSSITSSDSDEFTKLHHISEDSIEVLNKADVLDDMLNLWAGNSTPGSEEMVNMTNISSYYLERVLPEKLGYSLLVDGVEVINSSGNPSRISEADATTKTHASRLLIGYAQGLPTRGLVARAGLSNIRMKTTSAFMYFGGFVGQGNITGILNLPENITIRSIYLELNAGCGFDLYVNNNFCKNFPDPPEGYMQANIKAYASECADMIDRRGDDPNFFEFRFTCENISRDYIGGGFVEVEYNTSVMETEQPTGSMRFYPPEVDGIINYYSSLYVPGWVESMNINMTFKNNFTTFMYLGDKLVFNASGSNQTQNVMNGSLNLMNYFAASELSSKTVPLRIGTEGISYTITEGLGNADVILITDLSGSMRWQMASNNPTAVVRDCSDPLLYDDDTSRISVAKCLDDDFVERLLNTTGNRVGLVGFTTSASIYHELSSDYDSLISHIDSYSDSPSGGTCVCCAINKAIELLEDSAFSQQSWKYSFKSGCLDGCDPMGLGGSCDISGWESMDFDDDSWAEIDLPLSGNWENLAMYLRKNFTMTTQPEDNLTLHVRNKRGIECYLNENPVLYDSGCSTGNYWDNGVRLY